jgi:hypothetical protein
MFGNTAQRLWHFQTGFLGLYFLSVGPEFSRVSPFWRNRQEVNSTVPVAYSSVFSAPCSRVVKRSRFLYAISRTVICKGDNQLWQPNYSSVLGDPAAGGIPICTSGKRPSRGVLSK